MKLNRRVIAALTMGALLALAVRVDGAQTPTMGQVPYKNPALPTAVRVEDLLGRMTLNEKIAQLETIWESKA